MKHAIIKYLLRFSYPQHQFAKSILRLIDSNTKSELVDIPCGDGITSWHFARLNNLTVYGYDISPTSIENAENNFSRNNLFFEIADINEAIPKHASAKYFCIINSLFLLPQPDSILKNVHTSITNDGSLFVIVPNINGPNFKWFQEHNPGINKLLLAESEFKEYFSSCGWSVQKTIPLAYARTYGRKDTAMFSVFAPIYLSILNYFQGLFNGTPNYFLIVLKKI